MEQITNNNYCDYCDCVVGKNSRIDKPETSSGNALHEDIEIKCFYEGTATLLIESKTLSVKAGDIVVINPYEFHATVDISENQGRYHLFMLPLNYFSGIFEPDLSTLFFGEEKKFQTLFTGNQRMYDILMAAAEEQQQAKPYSNPMIKGLMIEFFTLLLREGIENTSYSPRKSNPHQLSVIKPALYCIKNDYERALTLDELAQRCNVSKQHFCRTFKAVTDRTPMEYLRLFRLQIANVLLLHTEKNIAEISRACGFEDPNFFSRCYKSNFGTTPKQIRQQKGNNL